MSRKVVKLILCLATCIAIAGIAFWVVQAQQRRPSFNPHVKAPEISQQEQEQQSSSEEKLDKRNSISDLFLEHPIEQAQHPLDPALLVAERGLEHIRKNVQDYTATVTKQERVNGRLLAEEFFECKIRHPSREASDENPVPLSFYLNFISPRSVAGREVIWVDQKNEGKLVAHEGGLLGIVRANLHPTDKLAMRGNRYPITELGIETLIVRMIEKGKRDRKRGAGNCLVTVDRTVQINDHQATLITITHPEKKGGYEFFQAKIYIDDELNLPVGYEGYLWAEEEGGEPVLIERYFYSDIKVNVGLTDNDFDPDNPDYKFPRSQIF